MKVLFIGGTGNISAAASRQAVAMGMDVLALNRGKSEPVAGTKSLVVDIHDQGAVENALGDQCFDVVADFVAFKPEDIERDIKLFSGRTGHYFFISTAAAYQKPPTHPVITESTPLSNPFWQYARNKIACEERLAHEYRERAFPVTIVRPSHTYDTVIPVPLAGWREYTIVDRMRRGAKIVVPGDGTSVWTLTHADDFAFGLLKLFGNSRAFGHAFHITSDELLTWDQIHTIIAEKVGAQPDIVHVPSDLIGFINEGRGTSLKGDKAWTAIFDNTKIRSFVPDFQARIPFRQGIARTLAWFDERPERKVINPANDAMIDEILATYAKAYPPALRRVEGRS